MGIESFQGYKSRQLLMPDGGKILCFHLRDGAPESGVHDANHNVFRLDKHGRVLWQINRRERPSINWTVKHQLARERGEPGCIEPFTRFVVYRPDGTLVKEYVPPDVPDERGFYEYWGLDEKNRFARLVTKEPPPRSEYFPDVMTWQPGSKVELFSHGQGTRTYSLDVETGEAVDVTPIGERPW